MKGWIVVLDTEGHEHHIQVAAIVEVRRTRDTMYVDDALVSVTMIYTNCLPIHTVDTVDEIMQRITDALQDAPPSKRGSDTNV